MSKLLRDYGCYIEDYKTINMIEESSTKIADVILDEIRCQFKQNSNDK